MILIVFRTYIHHEGMKLESNIKTCCCGREAETAITDGTSSRLSRKGQKQDTS